MYARRGSPGCARLPRLLMLAAGFKGWAFTEGLDLRETHALRCRRQLLQESTPDAPLMWVSDSHVRVGETLQVGAGNLHDL